MAFDIVVWAAVAWMMLMVFMVSTKNFSSMFLFKIAPFVISIALAVFWAIERGFIIHTGG
jgi:hypothetical protein